jgi:cell division protein FtsL
MKKPILFIILNGFVILTLSLVQVVVANSISTTGIEIGKIDKELATYKKKNAVLHEQVLIASSLTHVASVAATMGFNEAKTQLVVETPLPLAVR